MARIPLFLTIVASLFSSAFSTDSILLPPLVGRVGSPKLLLIVPVGPPEDYKAMAESIQKHSVLPLSVGIAVCKSHVPVFNITICDPEFELSPVLMQLITRANSTGALASARDVFVGGHSVGGACARRFVDTTYKAAGGVLFFSTQFTGDTENLLTGLIGYPSNVKDYPTPFIAMAGDLDKFSIDNIALTLEQWSSLDAPQKWQKYPVVLPGLDQSSYSFPYKIHNDIAPEVAPSAAVQSIGQVTGAWLDYVSGASNSTQQLASSAAITASALAPFLAARDLEQTWCSQMQKTFPAVPENTEVVVVKVPGYKLDSCHTKYEVKSDGSLKLTLCDYTSYSYTGSPPWEPQYAGAKEISCKFIGEDRIAQLLKLPLPDMNSAQVHNRCKTINMEALKQATALVSKYWPKAVDRYSQQGLKIVFSNDSQTYAGPQWLIEGLGFTRGSDSISVQGTALITTVKSLIYPGAHYCKLLSPSKVVDVLMTMGLTRRYK